MVVMQTDNDWTKAKMEVLPYGPMMFEPSATMINYGQSRGKIHTRRNDNLKHTQ
jgi:hypothetical protein